MSENPVDSPATVLTESTATPYYKRALTGIIDGVMSSELGCVAILAVIVLGIVIVPIVLFVALLFDLLMLPFRHWQPASTANLQIKDDSDLSEQHRA